MDPVLFLTVLGKVQRASGGSKALRRPSVNDENASGTKSLSYSVKERTVDSCTRW